MVRTNPEPDDGALLQDTYRTPLEIDSNGIDGESGVNLLEAKGRVVRILRPEAVGSPHLRLNRFGRGGKERTELLGGLGLHNAQSGRVRPAACSARASSASFARTSCDSANALDHRSSEAISSRRIDARASCSGSSSLATSERAFSRSWVTAAPPGSRSYSIFHVGRGISTPRVIRAEGPFQHSLGHRPRTRTSGSLGRAEGPIQSGSGSPPPYFAGTQTPGNPTAAAFWSSAATSPATSPSSSPASPSSSAFSRAYSSRMPWVGLPSPPLMVSKSGAMRE